VCVDDLLQVSGETLGEVKVVRDMHQRKAEMAKHADAFIALPGQSLASNTVYQQYCIVLDFVLAKTTTAIAFVVAS
jgi:hypothetical protein